MGWVKKSIGSVTLIVMQVVTMPCAAYIPEQQHKVINLGFMNHCRDFRTAEDYSNIPMVLSLREMNQRDIAAIIPMASMSNTNDGRLVATKVLAQSIGSLMQSDTIKNSGVGRTASSVEHAMDTSVSISGADSATKHTIGFKMKATESRAVVNYGGFADAQLSYQVGHSHELKLAMFQPLNKQAKIEFDSIANKDETVQKVSLNLSF